MAKGNSFTMPPKAPTMQPKSMAPKGAGGGCQESYGKAHVWSGKADGMQASQGAQGMDMSGNSKLPSKAPNESNKTPPMSNNGVDARGPK